VTDAEEISKLKAENALLREELAGNLTECAEVLQLARDKMAVGLSKDAALAVARAQVAEDKKRRAAL
jgi:hypothetical protein